MRAETLWKSLFAEKEEDRIKLPGQVLVYCLNLGHAIVGCEKARIDDGREQQP